MKRWFILGAMLLLAVALLQSTQPAKAAPPAPEIISLPNGFQPEGIVHGKGSTLYAGSRATGAIYQANLDTGTGSILVPAQAGRAALGLEYDSRTDYIFAAGGGTGNAYIYNATTGATVVTIPLTTLTPTFINDVVVTRDAAYFTDSSQPALYRVALGPGGKLPNTPTAQTITLGGEFQFVAGQFNANGIEASQNGKYLIVVNSFVGALYRVNPQTGDAIEIDLGTGSVPNGDGILLQGHKLYVVQNQNNQVAEVKLRRKFTIGGIRNIITNPNLDVPSTIANHGDALYVVNARFNTPPTPDTPYTVVKIR